VIHHRRDDADRGEGCLPAFIGRPRFCGGASSFGFADRRRGPFGGALLGFGRPVGNGRCQGAHESVGCRDEADLRRVVLRDLPRVRMSVDELGLGRNRIGRLVVVQEERARADDDDDVERCQERSRDVGERRDAPGSQRMGVREVLLERERRRKDLGPDRFGQRRERPFGARTPDIVAGDEARVCRSGQELRDAFESGRVGGRGGRDIRRSEVDVVRYFFGEDVHRPRDEDGSLRWCLRDLERAP
jgi:hypothetical protein